MKKSRFTEEQVIYALRLAESGTVVTDVCRQLGISEATFYVWKNKYASLGGVGASAAETAAGRERTVETAGGRFAAGGSRIGFASGFR
jgi:transposase-like protein